MIAGLEKFAIKYVAMYLLRVGNGVRSYPTYFRHIRHIKFSLLDAPELRRIFELNIKV